ncbi:MAG: DUF2927 domain-containing protein [Alphaproteobacteria bacterium]
MLVAASLLPTAFSAGALELSNAEIIQNFDVIAFRNEMREVINPRVSKWVNPIRVYKQFDAIIAPGSEEFLDKHMERLARLTGVSISAVTSRKKANFIIIFTRREAYLRSALAQFDPEGGGASRELQARLKRTHCLGIYRARESNAELIRAIVIIPVDTALKNGILRRCIVEETTQSMGLPNDSDDANPSIFNDSSPLKDLSAHDILLLKLLYHPALRVGMKRLDALRIAERILPRLRGE